MSTAVIVIILSLLLSAFFSGMEIAFVSSNKVHIELEKYQQDLTSKVLKIITGKPSKFIAAMLIGNNIALVVYGLFMGDLIMSWFQSLLPIQNQFSHYLLVEASLFSQTLISTLVILLTAEFLPKVFFQIYSNLMLRIFAIPAFLFYIIFYPISEFIIWISDIVLKVFFKVQGDQVQLTFSKVELGNYIDEQMEAVDEKEELDSEIQLFQNALQFSDVKSREVMVPRNEIKAVDIDASKDELTSIFTESGLSKLLVYRATNDDILGYIHSFELFKKPNQISDIIREVVFIPETMLVKDVMNLMTIKHTSIAVVVDEYGGTSGMLTVEDIVEELFGDIEDEHDSDDLIEQKINDNYYRFSARHEVDDLNEDYKFDLPESDNYETLGGMIVHYAEEIPDIGSVIRIANFEIKILEASSKKIEMVALKVLQPD
ncbi:MAG: hemolysin family protein [Psychroflexus sp.]|uniref:hemolysin family protein n=1 Tax=Psychroflexus sp. S27 TaxID=1982757 RepID=UPI000C2AF899|nr:hemolysin family protein [Psychroflexus sp. S27]PJX21589.1 hemolysin [Psychroflexus sp. S27]